MPGWSPGTQSGDGMTGLLARRAGLSQGDGSDVVASLETSSLGSRAAQFSRTTPRPAAEGLSEQARNASRATNQYIGQHGLADAAITRPTGGLHELSAARASPGAVSGHQLGPQREAARGGAFPPGAPCRPARSLADRGDRRRRRFPRLSLPPARSSAGPRYG